VNGFIEKVLMFCISGKNTANKTNQPDPFFVRAAHEKGSGYL